MRSILAVALLAVALSARAAAQQPFQSVHGIVRDSAGAPLGGAEVLIGQRRATTDPQGGFRVDSLRPGQYVITVRMVGYSPIRSRVAVVATEPTEVGYLLVPAPLLLPTMIVQGTRTGLFGAVGDTGYRAVVGALVVIAGPQGGEARSDSMGRFAFPELPGGQYMVRLTFPGYTERRVLVDLKRGEGRELAVLLAPFPGVPSRADEIALAELGKRLTFGLARERLSGGELARYGEVPLCDVPRIRSEIGRDRGGAILFSVNGVAADSASDLNRLCAWRADEVELVEFGSDICKDPTHTLADLTGTWCSGRTRNVTRSIAGGGQRIGSQPGGMKYVVVWEKK